MTTTSAQAISPPEKRILHQILQHTQEVSRYGFGDVFWVSGPSLDELSLQLEDSPHRLIRALNRLASKDLIAFETGTNEEDNIACPTPEGWQLHPQFPQMVPWIVKSEGFQDWEDVEPFASLDQADRERLENSPAFEPEPLPGVRALHTIGTFQVNQMIAPNYFIWPTAGQLEEMARLVHPSSRITCVVPLQGCIRFLTAAQFRKQMAGDPNDRINVILHHEFPNLRQVESAYIADARMYLVTSSWSASADAY